MYNRIYQVKEYHSKVASRDKQVYPLEPRKKGWVVCGLNCAKWFSNYKKAEQFFNNQKGGIK